jgi:serine protease Do
MATLRFRLLTGASLAVALVLIAGISAASGQGQDPDLRPPLALEKPMPESIADLKAIEAHVETLVKKVMPAVVNVKMAPAGGKGGGGQGSGVVISEDGMVLTAGHVSGTPDKECTLTFPDGKQVKAKSLGQNKGADSGLFKIIDVGKYPFVEMGKSSECKKGQWCIAIGHPGGLKPGRMPPVRLGRISAPSGSFITTDCTLVGGDSGGPLFDMDGKVIGIHSRIGNQITANMHVPVDIYRSEWERLVKGESWGVAAGGGKGGKGPSARLGGLEFDTDAKELKITKVEGGSAADKAGLKANDVILSVNGKKVSNLQEWRGEIGRGTGGAEVTVEVRRGEATLILKGVLEKIGA